MQNKLTNIIPKSIAVLPFVNMSGDSDNEYFSDGITEEIINALSSINGLKVTARTSSFAFKNNHIDIRTIGKQLGVATILEGSVRKSKEKIRITIQLIRTDDGFHLWSKKFDRTLEDIFTVQDEISLLIADQIRENYGHLEIDDHLVRHQKISRENYDLYLKGRYLIHRFNKEDCTKAISILKSVIKKEKQFAPAYAGIHYAYNSMVAAGLMPRKEALTEGKKFLDKAFKLEPNLPECHHSFGWHYLNDEWDFIKAKKHLARAIELRPGYMEAYQKLFITLILEGNIDASFDYITTAYKLDPLMPLNNYFLAYYYYIVQNFEKANYYFERLYQLEPNFIVGYSISALSLASQDRAKDIFELSARIPNIQNADVEKIILNTLAYAKLGDRNEVEQGIKELENSLNTEIGERILYFLINIETILGNHKRAFELIEIGISRRDPLITLLKIEPILTPLHNFDEWNNAMNRIYALSDNNEYKTVVVSKSIMPEKEINSFKSKITSYMMEIKPHLNPELSLKQLASELNIHPNKLSWLINVQIGKNFNEFINSYRIDEFKQKAIDPINNNLTLLGLAYECGFNSKTVFNSQFKKSTGMTPKEWLKSTLH